MKVTIQYIANMVGVSKSTVSRYLNGGYVSKEKSKQKEVMKYNPTAVIGATDNIILGFIRYAFENGYNIPKDISVAGFGGYDVGLAIHPTITTVKIDYETLGKKAANLIIALIEGKEIEEDKIVPINLIKRESVKSLK